MGQYHVTVNLDKREFINPYMLGDGLKLMEQNMSGPGGVTSALQLLLAISSGRGGGDFRGEGFDDVLGRWGGDRIATVGDYAEIDDLNHGHRADLIFSACMDDFEGAIAHWRKLAAEADLAENKGLRHGRPAEDWLEMADSLEAMGPYTDITERVREALMAEGFRYEVPRHGGRWLDRYAPWDPIEEEVST